MPLSTHTNSPIEVEISDRVYNSTIFKQKARFVSMHIHQDQYAGGCSIFVKVNVSLYANDAGAYGELIAGKGLTSYEVTLVADNNCAVNPKTGQVLYVRTNEMDDEWKALLEGKEEKLMLQGDFFETILHAQPVVIEPMLRDFLLQADQPQFNKFQ